MVSCFIYTTAGVSYPPGQGLPYRQGCEVGLIENKYLKYLKHMACNLYCAFDFVSTCILYCRYIFYCNLFFKYNLEVSPVLFAKTANLYFGQPFEDLGA